MSYTPQQADDVGTLMVAVALAVWDKPGAFALASDTTEGGYLHCYGYSEQTRPCGLIKHSSVVVFLTEQQQHQWTYWDSKLGSNR